MAKPFVRIDLSEKGQFFRPVALEPGCPLFDPTNANDRILFRWFRGMVPEPEWDENGEILRFYVRNDQGGRLEEVACTPVTNEDLNEKMVSEIERLQLRFEGIRPTSTTEKILYERLSEEFQDLVENKRRPDRTYYFFKYQDGAGLWRLVWIPGYAPIHSEFGPSLICDDEACGQLYVRLPGAKARCPICLAVPTAHRKAKEAARRKRNRCISLLLLLLLIGWVLWNQFTLRVVPGPWNAATGAVADFKIITPGLDGFGFILSKDVTHETFALVDDPSIVHFPDGASRGYAYSPGETKITFFTGWRWKTILAKVAPPTNPKRIWIEPAENVLTLGSTQRVRLLGEMEDESVVDLSHAAYWTSKNDGTVYFYNGFIEGLQPGKTKVAARYRATDKDKWMEASANVQISAEKIARLSVSIPLGDPLPPGKKAPIRVLGETEKGAKYEFTGSSRLNWALDPPAVAEYHGEYITPLQNGKGRLQTTLTDGTPEGKTLVTAETTFNVAAAPSTMRLRVAPKEASIAVDQVFSLSIVGGDAASLSIQSSDTKIVQVKNRSLVGCAPGSADVTISDGSQTFVIPVTVASIKADGLVMYPPRADAPIDHDVQFEFFARAGASKYYPILNDVVKIDSTPDSYYATADAKRNALRGVNPTEPSNPQKTTFSYQGQQRVASTNVIPAPMRLKITPSGEVKLPLGLCMTFDGYAVYGDGVSALVPYSRMEWNTAPTVEELEGFEFRGGKAIALAEGVGPINIWGKYFGTQSNQAVLTTTERADVTLSIEVDRPLRIAGETGLAVLTGRTPLGDVELAPNIGVFASSNGETIAPVGENSGVYKAINPGAAALSATHIAAEAPASVELRVVHPRNARIYWEPEDVQVAVDEVAPFQLMLEGRNPDAAEGEENVWNVPMNSPGVYYSFARPEAIEWRSPIISGVQEAEQFDVTASYLPYLKNPALAKVSVFKSNAPEALRVNPASLRLAPGQSASLAVEEQLDGASDFVEVQPEAVRWEVPSHIYWTDADGALRPRVRVPSDEKGSFTLLAKYRGKTAECQVEVAPQTLNPADPDVELYVVRQPVGNLLPIGQKQAYAIWMRKGEVAEPVPDAIWTPDFVGESFVWNAPVLEARQPGLVQWLQAKVGERIVRFYTQSVDPFVPGERPAPREGEPSAVRIVSKNGEEVSMPVGAKFVDYRVEAEYPDGWVSIVTKDATLHPIAGDKTVATPSNGELIGVKPGSVTYVAEYMGVDSEPPAFKINVTEGVDIDELRLEPDKEIRMLPNETVQFKLHGYKEGKSVGVLTGMDNIVWKSSAPETAEPQGATTTSKTIGRAEITAEFQGVTSAPATVDVVATIDEKLGPTDNVIKMMVGESKLVGKDFAIIRGNVDFSMQCNVVPLVPGVCEYDKARHALVGKTPGATDVIFTMADKKATMRVVVGGVDQGTIDLLKNEGEIVVEPAVVNLSAGHATELRVYAVSKDGAVRLERTASAIFSSSDPSVCEVRGLQICALKPGTAAISVRIPEIAAKAKAGNAVINVDDKPITELSVEPGAIRMSAGDSSNLFIQGRSATGQYPLFAQPRLKTTVDGAAAKMNGIQTVEALAAGNATINIDWDGKVKRSVSVTVDDNPYTSLAIDPLDTTVAVGDGRAYQITALRGGRLYVIQPEGGLQLSVADPNIASVRGNMVFGKAPGQTKVIARFANMTAEATLRVAEPGSIPTSVESAYVDPNAAVTYRPADTVWDGGYSGVVSSEIFGEGAVVPYVTTDAYSVGNEVTGLRFEPSSVRLAQASGPVPLQVYEELANGSRGRDVSADPDLVVEGTSLVAVERGADGRFTIRPTGKEGASRLGAKLNGLSALPMFVQVGDVAASGATLMAMPAALEMTVGSAMTFDSVRVIPEAGVAPFEVAYRVSTQPGSAVVSVEGTTTIRADMPGTTQVIVSSIDPQGVYDNLTTVVPVTVTKPLNLTINPAQHSMRIGETTPQFIVTARDDTGAAVPIGAVVESADPSILAPDPLNPGRFRAVSMGTTQVRGIYASQEVSATVSVAGDRFMQVDATGMIENPSDFSVTLSVAASADAGALEYRIYEAGTPAPEAWQTGAPGADGLNIMLNSPPVKYRGRNDRYTLIIESRSAGGTDIQQYPYNFVIGGMIKKVD
ncbi:MAG: hypothetical protein Q4D38_09635 [Planctomycetia bacterium]|nr:hypothetical protein [Planctomycetia bacterium]